MKQFYELPMPSNLGHLEMTCVESAQVQGHLTHFFIQQSLWEIITAASQTQVSTYLCSVSLNILSETCIVPSNLNN